jgi:hypothetical protein
MSIIKRRNNLLINIFGKFLGFDFGVFTLNHGKHEIFVPTKIHPNSVWVKTQDIGNEACCQNTINEIGYATCCNGIAFKINVQSEKVIIKWFAGN